MNLMDPPDRFEGKALTIQLLYASLRSACPHWREQERGELLVSKGETFEMVASYVGEKALAVQVRLLARPHGRIGAKNG